MKNEFMEEAVQAFKDFCAIRSRGGKNWKIDYSRRKSSGFVSLETATMFWRAMKVYDTIYFSVARTPYQRAIVMDLVTHVHGDGLPIESFRGAPRGAANMHLVVNELRALQEKVAAALEKGEGRPCDLTCVAADAVA